MFPVHSWSQAQANSNIAVKDIIGMLYSVARTFSLGKLIFLGLEKNHDVNIVVENKISLTEFLWRFVWNLSDSRLNQTCTRTQNIRLPDAQQRESPH
jgi:hypothetical protein